jgi:hypothetical protein
VSILLLRAADEEYLSRLAAFTEAHPEVEVVIVGYPGSGGTWQAIIPEPGGETIVVRYTAPGAARQARRAHGGPVRTPDPRAYMRLAALLRDQITPGEKLPPIGG